MLQMYCIQMKNFNNLTKKINFELTTLKTWMDVNMPSINLGGGCYGNYVS